ncbi:MAG: cytochrome c [Flavobacterium sp.]|nr:cytochrome c [Flavobacterium sp.]
MKKYIVVIALIAFVSQSFTKKLDSTDYFVSKTNLSEDTVLQQVNNGKIVYNKTCVACHQMNGAGIPGAFPPLAKSDYLNADVNRAIKQTLNGSLGPITVNGKKYVTPMPKQVLSDQQIADVLTYIYASWGNNKSIVTPEMVKAIRK